MEDHIITIQINLSKELREQGTLKYLLQALQSINYTGCSKKDIEDWWLIQDALK